MTHVRTEVLAGVTTFVTMAYIVFVQPAVLGAAGMDPGAVLMATCLASAFATALMGRIANYPIAVAPAMGHNFFFAYTVVLAQCTPWQTALGAVAIAGLLFIATAGFGLRERVIAAVPEELQHAIGAGIGLLIAFIGLQWSGVIVDTPGTLVGLGNLRSPVVLLSTATLVVTAALMARRVTGALLIGMGLATIGVLALGLIQFDGVFSWPPSLSPTLLQLDVIDALRPEMLDVVFVFFFLALFDSVGTLVGVAGRMGLVRNGTIPRARQALLADAVGTVVGAGLGTSTVTAYIESATGVAAGGRTGRANYVTAGLFLLVPFCYPLVRMIGGGVTVAEGVVLYPIVAPALILVGVMMMAAMAHVAWNDLVRAIPAFLTIVIIPLTMSITDGIAFGFVAAAVLHLATGQARRLHPWVYVFAVLFVARYALSG